MLLAKAFTLIDRGQAVIVGSKLRVFNFNPTDAGYDRAGGFVSWRGRQSYDPVLGGGPTVLQGSRT